MIESYENVVRCIDELILFLERSDIFSNYKSHLENDYLIAHEFYEAYKKNPLVEQDENGRAALVGLFELYKWVWSVKDCKEFNKLNKHLKLLIQASPRINSVMPMINPVTQKQDDKTNKFIEAIVGMYAVKIGNNIDLDDPEKSSGGNNPDVLLDYNKKRIAIACKTLTSKSTKTILDNLRVAANQIERANCDIGYILINAMNILEHQKISGKIYCNHIEPIDILWQDIDFKYKYLRDNEPSDIFNIFCCQKVRPIILTFVHSVTRISSLIGNLSTSLKTTFATDFRIPNNNTTFSDTEFLSGINEFIHNKL